jgi:hypothetical protein
MVTDESDDAGDADEWPTGWPPSWALVRWAEAEVGADDRTVTVRFNATFEEDSLVPTLSAELSSDAVTLALRLEPVAPNGGVWVTKYRDAPPDHEATIVLPELVEGRALVDAWRPAPPPPVVRRTLAVGREFGPVARGRQLFLDTVDLYDERADLNYRLRPGERGGDDDRAGWDVLAWSFDVEDDLGTEYETPGGAYGSDDEEVQGSRDIFPSPPSGARTLTLIVYDDDGMSEFGTSVGRVTLPLGGAEPSGEPART